MKVPVKTPGQGTSFHSAAYTGVGAKLQYEDQVLCRLPQTEGQILILAEH